MILLHMHAEYTKANVEKVFIGYVYICTVAQSGKVYEQSVGSWVEMFTQKWKSTVFYCSMYVVHTP